jgi:lambda family phage tail tape measure protein
MHAYAKGGVVHQPTLFRFAHGTGLMGEAGPEAIMPLTRLPDGNLGVGRRQPEFGPAAARCRW